MVDCFEHFFHFFRRAKRPPDNFGAAPATVAGIRAALASMDCGKLGEDDDDAERPIFLLANGWRSGSTLLQRILVTDPNVLLWGEPLGRSALIPRLTEALCALTADWPPDSYWINGRESTLSSSWIANLFPPAGDLRAALRQWVIRWLAEPARQRGFTRWGLKEVRLSAADACLLRWLFPKAHFLILLRHPVDAYRSARRSAAGVQYWYRWPDAPVQTVIAYAYHWNRLALSWRELPSDFGHVVVKYEQIVSGEVDFRAIEASLGLRLDEQQAVSVQVGATRDRRGLRRSECRRVHYWARQGMEAFDYSVPD